MRRYWKLFVVAGVVAVLGGILALYGTGATRGASVGSLHGGVVRPAFAKPDVALTDTSGKPFNIQSETQGYVTVVFFGYSHCPDTCPTFMNTMAQAVREMKREDARHVRVVFVTVDPQRDTPDALRRWLDNFDTSFIGLTGTTADIGRISAPLGVPASQIEKLKPEDLDYFVEHFAGVYVFTTDNEAHLMYPATGITPRDWAADLTTLVQNSPQGLFQ